MSCFDRPNHLRRIVRKQQQKTAEQMKQLTVIQATQGGYHSLSRQDKRRAEHMRSRVAQEDSLQRDIKRADRLASRIAQVIEQLMKSLTQMKQHLGSYTFANTTGKDSDGTGSCESDLSTAIDTRAAWKEELKQLMTLAAHYMDAQVLGNYAIMHTVPASTGCPTPCCPRVYRSAFYFATPTGDCLSMGSGLGGHSGDSSVVKPDGDTGSEATTPAAEAKSGPHVLNSNVITNKDMQMREMMQLFIDGDQSLWTARIEAEIAKAVVESGYAAAETQDSNDNTNKKRIDVIRNYLKTVSCLPEALADEVYETAYEGTNIADLTTLSLEAPVFGHLPIISSIEDEPDLPHIIAYVVERLHALREFQTQNDREQARLRYVQETSEATQAFHQTSLDELLEVDMTEVVAKSRVGKKLCAELAELSQDLLASKQSFFSDC